MRVADGACAAKGRVRSADRRVEKRFTFLPAIGIAVDFVVGHANLEKVIFDVLFAIAGRWECIIRAAAERA